MSGEGDGRQVTQALEKTFAAAATERSDEAEVLGFLVLCVVDVLNEK